MKRNSNSIGALATITNTSAAGVYDTFDAFNYTVANTWPPTIRVASLSPNTGNINENTQRQFTITTTGVVVASTLYWTILHITSTSSDFFGSVVSGNFNISTTNTATFNINTNFTGNTAKSPKTFKVEIRGGSTSGSVLYTSDTFTIPAITSSVQWTTSTINESTSSSLQVSLGNIGGYSTSYAASISYTGSTASTTSGVDFSTVPTTFYIGAATNITSLSPIQDLLTEGTETLTAAVNYGGYNLGSASLTVTDSSQSVTATVTPSVSSVNEGSSVTFTINITSGNFSSGTLYWTLLVSGSVTNADFSSPSLAVTNGGSVNISGSTGSVTFTLSNDVTTESVAESFQFRLRAVSTSGSIITTSSSVTINDTSTGAAQPYKIVPVNSTTVSASTNPGPCNIYYQRSIICWTITASEIQTASGLTSGNISRMRFYVPTSAPYYQPLPSYAIGMKLTTNGISTAPTNNGFTIVKNASSESFTANTYKEFIFNTTFSWNNSWNLAIVCAWGQCPTTYNASGQHYYTNTGNLYYSLTDSAGTYTINTDNFGSSLTNHRPVVELYF